MKLQGTPLSAALLQQMVFSIPAAAKGTILAQEHRHIGARLKGRAGWNQLTNVRRPEALQIGKCYVEI